MSENGSATDWLLPASAGEAGALERVFPLVYDELRRLAHRQLQREPTGHTLTTTDLVHDAYLRLIDQARVQWGGRAHFMAIAATAMRRILVDHARSHRSLKRGGGVPRVPLESVELATEDRADLLLGLDEALNRLGQLDARQARVVECRFFGGMTEEETAEAVEFPRPPGHLCGRLLRRYAARHPGPQHLSTHSPRATPRDSDRDPRRVGGAAGARAIAALVEKRFPRRPLLRGCLAGRGPYRSPGGAGTSVTSHRVGGADQREALGSPPDRPAPAVPGALG